MNDLRESIDAADDALLDILARRAQLVDQVAVFKRGKHLPMLMPAREQKIIEAARTRAGELNLSADIVEQIFRCVLAESHRRMNPD